MTFIQNIKNIDLCRKWLFTSVIALAFSGLLSIAVILLRSPAINNLVSGTNFFDAALVIHVDLSVLVWVLSITSLIWCTVMDKKHLYIANYIWGLSFLGTCFMACSIFIPGLEPVKNNYIPILHNLMFLSGLGMFIIAIVTNAALITIFFRPITSIEIGIYCSAILILLAFFSCILAYNSIPSDITMYDFYEYLFWGGGHILQFAYVQILVIIYMIILKINNSRLINWIFIANVLLISPGVLVYFIYTADDPDLIIFFTKQMKYIGGLLPIIIIFSLKNFRLNLNYTNTVLLWSLSLFIYGGLLGLAIHEVNVTIPAHYHGSIVSLTIALIGFVYMLLPKLGFAQLSNKVANIQILMYGIGQTLHISGLAWMGGYGALRKTAGMVLPIGAKIGYITFVIGGILAVIAGLLFVIIMIKSFYQYWNSRV